VVKLVDKEKHEKLRELGIITAKCWNEVNWLRMQQFKKREKVDFAKSEKEVYEKYKNLLKVNAQQVARKNAENWRSFFSLIEEKRGEICPSGSNQDLQATGGMREIRGNGLKASLVYRWTSRAGWVKKPSYEVMKMKAVNHKLMIRPEGTLAL